jgi:catechol 2,3-dioxygenase-like lactoylglutathione lyase family enzyme
MELQFGHIEIFVKEPLKSKDFYINILGFKLIETQHDKFVWLKHGEKVILLRPGKNTLKAATYQKANIAIVIYADNIEKAVGEFQNKGVKFKGDDGKGCYTFKDPDGNWIQLVDPNH